MSSGPVGDVADLNGPVTGGPDDAASGSGPNAGTSGSGPDAGASGSPTGLALRRVLVLNGPNLGRLGSREPEVYGRMDFAAIAAACRAEGEGLGLDVDVRQTDDETELVHWLHEAADAETPVVLNPAAFTHYSYALRDACAQLRGPLVEVHITNPAAREEFRHTSVVAGVATGTIAGFGLHSYLLALRAVAALLAVRH